MAARSRSDDALPAAVVHPLAVCETDSIGAGTRVWAFSHILPGATVGRGCNICEQCYIESGASLGDNVTVKNGVQVWDKVRIDDDVFVGPNATFTNDLRPRAFLKRPPSEFLSTRVCRGATIGANATVVCGVTIGAFAFVAAGAVVRADVPAHGFVAGNPATQRGWVCTCAARLPESLTCGDCGRRFRHPAGGDGLVETPTASGAV